MIELGGCTQVPIVALNSQTKRLTGNEVAPVSADSLISPAAPRFRLAIKKAPVGVLSGIERMPPGAEVRATRSGTGVSEAESKRVLKPMIIGADVVLAQSKMNDTSTGAKGAVGTNVMLNFWEAPAEIFTGVLASQKFDNTLPITGPDKLPIPLLSKLPFIRKVNVKDPVTVPSLATVTVGLVMLVEKLSPPIEVDNTAVKLARAPI